MIDDLQPRTERLLKLAHEKTREYAARPGVVAVAITGSLARGTTWAGSDVDLWGFMEGGDDAFEDGMVDDLYWEIDLRPVSWLDVNANDWLRPPSLDDESITALEALYGCQIVRDDTGALTRVRQLADGCMADSVWLNRRADYYLYYGLGALDALEHADSLTTIVRAREITIRYGVAVYWMRRGRLLSSGMRIAERLKNEPRIYELFHAIFGLGGQAALEQFLVDFESLPAHIWEAVRSDIEYEVMPMVRLGMYDGALVYMRQIIAEHPLADVAPVLGLSDDVAAQKQTVLAQALELVALCGRTV
jgi:hypothetical protein